MSIYKKYCTEVIDENRALKEFKLNYPDDFNFGYDVVDAIAQQTPDKKAIVWCNTENEEHIFSFSDVSRYSNKMANVFKDAGITKGDKVMLVLKRHYEYWFAAVALHKLGAVMIPATHMLTVSDFEYRIKASGVKAVVCTAHDDVPEKIAAALKNQNASAIMWTVQQDV
ncbi:MAG TPA: AMP-binding protein, partial [Candidatus Faeciplasma gallinarum]|nr:AMP-binding protein [Candidatus Faeciplasma gallinarum]